MADCLQLFVLCTSYLQTVPKYQAIDIIEDLSSDLDGFDGFCIGNVIKYIWRFKHKNGCEDLEKAKWYLEKVIKKYKEL